MERSGGGGIFLCPEAFSGSFGSNFGIPETLIFYRSKYKVQRNKIIPSVTQLVSSRVRIQTKAF